MSAMAYVFGSFAAAFGVLACAMFRLTAHSDDPVVNFLCVVFAAVTGALIVATVRWM